MGFINRIAENMETVLKLGHDFSDFFKHNYSVISATAGGSVASTYLLISTSTLAVELLPKMIIAICCTIVSFATSVILKYLVVLAKKIASKKKKNE